MPDQAGGRPASLVAAAGFEALQFHQRSLDVRASGFKVGPAGIELAQDVLRLRALAPRGVIQIDDGPDLFELEAQAPAPKDEAEAGSVAAVVDPLGAAALGGDQADVLVVPQCAVRDPKFGGDLGDRPG